MPQDHDISKDIKAIRLWMSMETHLPQDIDDLLMKKFLHSCYYSLERTKKCIEEFCSTRAVMKEIYTNRCYDSKELKTAFSITKVASYRTATHEILVHQLDDPNLDSFVFYDVLKTFTMQGDCWLKTNDYLPEGHIIVLDIKHYALKIITKVNVMFFRDFLVYLLSGMPVRVQQVHLVNCPSYYKKLYALVKPVLPAEICDIIKFHPTHEGLYESVEKKYLPKDYGGEAAPLRDQHCDWIRKIQDDKKTYENNKLWTSDLSKKSKTVDNTMNGSFRTLSID